jgi:hypothetical protein
MDAAKIMRENMKLMEYKYVGAKSDNANVKYDATYAKSGKEAGVITKVTAVLTSYESGKYTRLAQNVQRLQELAVETLELENQVKQDARDTIADLFHAEDAAYTRVVETVSFILSITKDNDPATTVKYAQVLDELQSHLTPELVKVLESIKEKFSTVQKPKPPSLKWSAKTKDQNNESATALAEAPMEKMKMFFTRYLSKILAWGNAYDAKLEKLRNMVEQETQEESVYESEGNDIHSFNPNVVANDIWTALSSAFEQGHTEIAPLGHGAKGGSVNVKAPDNTTFEISVKQIS